VLAQVRNGVSIRMAALYLLLSGDTREPAVTAVAPSAAHSNTANLNRESH
jgi:aspartate carbamoyltransferase catalytic subunit